LTYALAGLGIPVGARHLRGQDFEGRSRHPRGSACSRLPGAPQFPTSIPPAPPDFDPLPDGTITVPSSVDNTGPNARTSFSKTTIRRRWDITDDSLLYASYETGFKAGGFFSTDSGVYKPEEIGAWTIGSKMIRWTACRSTSTLDWTSKDQRSATSSTPPALRS
jgi:hypothetical protein